MSQLPLVHWIASGVINQAINGARFEAPGGGWSRPVKHVPERGYGVTMEEEAREKFSFVFSEGDERVRVTIERLTDGAA